MFAVVFQGMVHVSKQGRSQDLAENGAMNEFFQILKFAETMRFARGFGGGGACSPKKKF